MRDDLWTFRDAIDRLVALLVKRGQDARDTPPRAVVPVKHVIQIEVVK